MNRGTFYASLAGAALVSMASVAAQSGGFSAETNMLYGMIKNNLVRAAEKVAEADYAFKPTPEVRSFGQLVGHVTNAQFMFCSIAKGEKNPHDGHDFEKTTAKADLVKALKDSVAYCDGVYASMTDTAGAAKAKLPFMPQEMSRLTLLNFNVAHDNEHYGNIVTYMRMKGLVPPSSEQQPRRPSGQ
jgi:uncharacterized damage-inducible protein DinB